MNGVRLNKGKPRPAYGLCFRTAADCESPRSRRGSYGPAGFSGGFEPGLAGPYPSIEEELKKDVSILRSSLAIRDDYIDRLRETRDYLSRKLDVSLLIIESQKRRISDYRNILEKLLKQEYELELKHEHEYDVEQEHELKHKPGPEAATPKERPGGQPPPAEDPAHLLAQAGNLKGQKARQ